MKNNRINPNESNDDDQQRILRRLGIQLRRTSAISCNLFFGIFNAAVVTRNFHLVHCHHRAEGHETQNGKIETMILFGVNFYSYEHLHTCIAIISQIFPFC